MNATEIMKNILHFYETVLPKAYHSPFWDEESITNAFQWAQFCEQMYQKFSNIPLGEKLDEFIHSINSHFQQDGKLNMCFEDLNRGSAVLTQAFFENPNIENDLYKSVLLKIEKNENAADKNMNDAAELDSLCMELLEALKPVSIVNSDRSFHYEVKAELFLDSLKNATRELSSEDLTEKHLSLAFEALYETPDKLILLVHVFMHKTDDEKVKEIQEFGIHWMLLKILADGNCSIAHCLWRQSAQKLRLIAVNSVTFYSFYINFLTKSVSSVECDPEVDALHWKSNLSSSDGTMLSFYGILNHFRCLLSIDDSICESTKQHLLDLVNSQIDSTVWREIFSRVT